MREMTMRFSGGKDSTLAAALMARQFDRVHLLTFKQPLIIDIEKVVVNVQKLRRIEGKRKFIHTIIDIEDLLKKAYYHNLVRDVAKYWTFARANLCTLCDLSMIVNSLIYCLRNNIRFFSDGANKTGFDPLQQQWGFEIIKKFCKEYGIIYQFPIYDVSRTDIELLKIGLNAKNPTIFFRSQPYCCGGGLFHNIYLRCYFLPLYGYKKYKIIATEWLNEKLDFFRAYIDKVIHSNTHSNS